MPWRYRKQRQLLRKMNPGYKYVLWTEQKAIAMICRFYPEFLKMFVNLKEPIERVDTFKYFLLHRYGGIYLDADIISKRPLSRFFAKAPKNPNIILSKENRYIIDKISLSNCVMMSKPRCKFWMDIIEYIFSWTPTYTALLDNHMKILEKTGPIMLYNMYQKNMKRYSFYITPDTCFMTDNPSGYLYHTSDKMWVDSRLYKNFAVAVAVLIVILVVVYYLLKFISGLMARMMVEKKK